MMRVRVTTMLVRHVERISPNRLQSFDYSMVTVTHESLKSNLADSVTVWNYERLRAYSPHGNSHEMNNFKSMSISRPPVVRSVSQGKTEGIAPTNEAACQLNF
eukprot:3300740-Amphidinium_carterae.1